MTVRLTQQVVQVFYTADADARLHQQYTEVLATLNAPDAKIHQQYTEVLHTFNAPDAKVHQQYTEVLHTFNAPDAKVHQQFIEVLVKIHTPVTRHYISDITATATVEADLTIPKLTVDFTATAIATANLTGLWQINADITGVATVDAELSIKRLLTAGITVTGDVTTAGLRKNIEHLEAVIITSGDVTAATMAVPWHSGSTLALTQSVEVTLVLLRDVEHTLTLTDAATQIGDRNRSASNALTLTDVASTKRVLPTKTASNTLSLTGVGEQSRGAASYLVLTQSASAIIFFLEGPASNALSLTDSVSPAGSVFNVTAQNLLNLTQSAVGNKVALLSPSNTLALGQNAFALTLGTKTYVMLQAPFNLIQTTVVLPNPLLNDNESLVSNIMIRRSMDNTPRTYIKRSSSRKLKYTFILNRLKALELEAFFNAYNGAHIKMLNWKGELWKVKLITNPVDFVQTRRAEPGGDQTDVNLEFEGVRLNG